ncbi:hypothetical protein GETHLI_17340 [Geothrix limicola]|uniref:Uncharacterized protein n=1 Tax=Geothrix limicola TaxID=2927978 RepID=A0ABQ5QF10_9BACT|nr:hypothetical protein [Geothrix limicola]GLH73232.1 hypothetical protein GETHLI_17340 [Geothrix limicola]
MKTILCTLLLLLENLACARIYRPIEVLAAPIPGRAEDLSGHLAPQPWGDNSRYEDRAREAGLQLLVLGLENHAPEALDILGLEGPTGAALLSPEAALDLVRQRPIRYLIYPLIPAGLMGLAFSNTASSLADPAFWLFMATTDLVFGLPNAWVAARSNARLGACFRERAFRPGSLPAGGIQRGLVFLRSPVTQPPPWLRIRFRSTAGEQRLDVLCSGTSHEP